MAKKKPAPKKAPARKPAAAKIPSWIPFAVTLEVETSKIQSLLNELLRDNGFKKYKLSKGELDNFIEIYLNRAIMKYFEDYGLEEQLEESLSELVDENQDWFDSEEDEDY
jgi:hypothetical protein